MPKIRWTLNLGRPTELAGASGHGVVMREVYGGHHLVFGPFVAPHDPVYLDAPLAERLVQCGSGLL